MPQCVDDFGNAVNVRWLMSPGPLCTDDYGVSVYPCWHTSRPTWADTCVIVGAIVPGVKNRHIIHPESVGAHKQSGIWFHESERNCNTCPHLSRVQRPKNTAGFLYGRCNNPEKDVEAHPYANREVDGVMTFHPDDPMHMPCYSSRWNPDTEAKES